MLLIKMFSACECNSHADSCSFNETKGYGVCNDCKHNTTGDMCQLCKETFYKNAAVSQNASHTCLGKYLYFDDNHSVYCMYPVNSNVCHEACKIIHTNAIIYYH